MLVWQTQKHIKKTQESLFSDILVLKLPVPLSYMTGELVLVRDISN